MALLFCLRIILIIIRNSPSWCLNCCYPARFHRLKEEGVVVVMMMMEVDGACI